MKKPTKQSVSEVRHIGLDIGDRYSRYAVSDAQGEIVQEGRVHSTPSALEKTFGPMKGTRLLMEVGTHSPWMQRKLKEIGIDARVCDARSAGEANRFGRKTDERDARLLAELLRTDSHLVKEIVHRSESDQMMMNLINARDGLVAARTMLVNKVRMMVKSTGERLTGTAAAAFNNTWAQVKEGLRPALSPLYVQIRQMTQAIREYDSKIEDCIKTEHPEAELLTEIPGVGALTALAFVLAVGDVKRFKRSRDVGAYLGLVPKKRESGDSDPQLGISKRGNATVRRLLVCAAQYILGPFNKTDTDLKRFGLSIVGGGSDSRRKRRAVVATARKLSVVMAAVLMSKKAYEPLRNEKQRIPA